MTDNLRIWNAVQKTNPAHTKKVNQRGGFTSISASYQILAATEQFGPIGIGWGYTTTPPIIAEGLIIVCVTIWHGSRDNAFGPIPGCADLLDHKGKVDSDAPKKAMTDGITKGLSQLGFNADVFLGLYDDNKYVAQVTAEFAAEERANKAPATIRDDQRDVITKLAESAGVTLLTICEAAKIKDLRDLPADKYESVKKKLNLAIDAKVVASEDRQAA